MSLTEEQKAFQTRKMKTRFTQMDINGDGYISVEDYRELEKRFIEYGKLSGEAEQRLRKRIQVLESCSDYSIIKYLLLLLFMARKGRTRNSIFRALSVYYARLYWCAYIVAR